MESLRLVRQAHQPAPLLSGIKLCVRENCAKYSQACFNWHYTKHEQNGLTFSRGLEMRVVKIRKTSNLVIPAQAGIQ